MKQQDVTDMGFSLSWSFYAEADNRYETYPESPDAIESVIEDLSKVFSICARYELFFPEFVRNDAGDNIVLQTGKDSTAIEQIRRMLQQEQITYEIEQIGGYGLIVLPDGEKATVENLIGIGPVRLFERQINLYTTKSVWTPLRIDKTYQFNWQVETARLNAGRLENCLKDIHNTLGIMVSPSPDEIDKDNPVWQAGFRLFVNPEILLREYESSPPSAGLLSLDEFLLRT